MARHYRGTCNRALRYKDNNNNKTTGQQEANARRGKATLTLAAGREAKDHKATPSGQQKSKKNKSCALIWHRAGKGEVDWSGAFIEAIARLTDTFTHKWSKRPRGH